MLNKYLATIMLVSSCHLAQAQVADLAFPFGKTTFNIDANKNVTWNSTSFTYNLGSLNYTGQYSGNTQLHVFGFKLQGIGLNYSSSTLQNVFTLNFNGFTVVNEGFNRSQVLPVYASKVVADNRQTLAYTGKNSSFNITKISGPNTRIDSYSFSLNKNKLDYMNSENALVMIDAWNRPYLSKNNVQLQVPHFNVRMMDGYSDLQFNDKNYTFRTIDSPTRSEDSFSYKLKDMNLQVVDFDDVYSKTFVNFSNKNMKLNFVSDDNDNVGLFQFKDTTLGYSTDASYLQTKINKFDIKVAEDKGDYQYDVKSGNFGFKDGSLYGKVKLAKGLDVGASFENGVEQINYTGEVNGTKINFKYNNRFDVYDFYFRQSVFSVYDNSFAMIGNTKTQYKDSTSFSLTNKRFNFSSDVINDIYLITFRYTDTIAFNMLKDQKQNYVGLTTSGKVNLSTQYNLNSNRFDRLGFNYKIEF